MGLFIFFPDLETQFQPARGKREKLRMRLNNGMERAGCRQAQHGRARH